MASIYEEIFNAGKQSAQNAIPGLSALSGILGIINAGNLKRRATSAFEPNQFDQSYADQYNYYADQLRQLTGQMADVNNPQFQTRVQQRMDEIMRSHTDALRQQQSLAAQRVGRGLQGTVNPERRDEAMSKNLAVLRQQAEAQARAEVMRELFTAAQASGNASQQVGNLGLRGAQDQRARQVAQTNAQDYYDQTRQQGYLALAKEILPWALKNMNIGKAMDVTGALSKGWVSDAEQAASIGRPFTNPAVSNWAAPPMAAPAQNWTAPAQPDAGWGSFQTPDFSGAWDSLPDFSLPTSTDPSDWWAMDSSVDLGWDWGTGADWGNLDYGQFF